MKKTCDKSTDKDLFQILVTKRLDRIDRMLEWLVKIRVDDDMLEVWRNPVFDDKGTR